MCQLLAHSHLGLRSPANTRYMRRVVFFVGNIFWSLYFALYDFHFILRNNGKAGNFISVSCPFLISRYLVGVTLV
jgi:hypothetical protein